MTVETDNNASATVSEPQACGSHDHQSVDHVRSKISRRRKLLFAAITLFLFFVLLELGLSLLGVAPVTDEEDPYVGFSSYLPLFEQKGSAFETCPNKLAFFNHQSFTNQKSDQTIRVFCVGGSTTYGRPYNDDTSFAGWLRLMLKTAAPDKNWEVINAGGISYASYRVARLMQELASYQPDLFIVYCGHNEFLEERTYRDLRSGFELVPKLGALVSHTRTYSLLRRIMKQDTTQSTPDRAILPDEVVTLLDRSIGPQNYHRNDALKNRIKDHYELNLRRITAQALECGANVLLVVPACNERDCSPFKSEYTTSTSIRQQLEIESTLETARRQLRSGKFEQALKLVETTLALDPRFAESHYLRGRVLYELGRFGDAKAAFSRAICEDICPLRILPDMQTSVKSVGRDFGVRSVNFAELAARNSPHQITGSNLFLDHVHPTIEGNKLLASAVLNEMVDADWLRPNPLWTPERLEQISAEKMAALDQSSHGIALRNLSKVFGWAGKTNEAFDLAIKAVSLAPEDPETQFQAGIVYEGNGDLAEAESCYRKAGELDPEFAAVYLNLGVVLGKRERLDEALSQFRVGLNYAPESAAIHANMATIFALKGDFDSAVEHQAMAVKFTESGDRSRLQHALHQYRQSQQEAKPQSPSIP